MIKNFIKIVVSCVFILALSLVGIQVANAADYYVDNTASGANNGTSWANAWESFADISWTTLDDADTTLWISGGAAGQSYSETLVIVHATASYVLTIRPGAAHPTLSAGRTGRVTINPSSAQHGIQIKNGYVTINGNDGSGNRWFYVTPAASGVDTYSSGLTNIKLLYLEITGCGHHGIKVNQLGSAYEIGHCYIHDVGNLHAGYGDAINGGPVSSSFGNLTIHDCTLRPEEEDGINVGGGTDVYDCTIDGTGCIPEGHPDGYQGSKGYTRIYNNDFVGWNQAVFIEFVADSEDYVFVANNVFRILPDDGTSTMVCKVKQKDTGGGSWTMNHYAFINNTVITPDAGAVSLTNGTCTFTILDGECSNNIIYSSTSWNIDFSYAGIEYTKANLQVYNNIQYNTAPAIGYDATDDTNGPSYANFTAFHTGTGFSGNVYTQPIFVDYDNNNYHLASNDTVAINQGKDLSAIWTAFGLSAQDKDGVARPVGAAWDIGAYEFTGAAAPSGTLVVAGGIVENEVVTGGKTLDIDLTGTTYDVDIGTDCAETTTLIAGLTSNKSEAGGWNAVVKAGLTFNDVALINTTKARITLPAFAAYDITESETITVTIHSTCVASATEIVASPTFIVSVDTLPDVGGVGAYIVAGGLEATLTTGGVAITTP